MSATDPIPTPFLIAFVGWHNSGKTTVAVQVAALLQQQGFRVGVLKSTKERGLAPDRTDSDTSRYSRSGAMRVALVAPDALIVREHAKSTVRRDPVALARFLFSDMDFVLIEGCKHARGLPKIEVRREGIAEEPISTGEAGQELVALVCDSPVTEDLPCFRTTDSTGLARFITELAAQELKLSPRQSPVLDPAPSPPDQP